VPAKHAKHYPRQSGGGWDGKVLDLDGNVVGEVTF
jgi:hypothetical protein